MTPLRRRMLEDMQIRNLADNTQESYVRQVSLFARHLGKSPEVLGPEAIRTYQIYLTNERKLAPSSVLVAVSALRFLYVARGISQAHGDQSKRARARHPGSTTAS